MFFVSFVAAAWHRSTLLCRALVELRLRGRVDPFALQMFLDSCHERLLYINNESRKKLPTRLVWVELTACIYTSDIGIGLESLALMSHVNESSDRRR